MSSRQEEKERLRQQRLAAEARSSSSNRWRLYAGYAVAGALGLAVVVGLVVVIASGDDGGGGGGGADLPDNAHIAVNSGVFRDAEPDGREGTEPPELQFGDLAEAAKRAGCELNLDLEEFGNSHFTDVDEATYEDYESKPPTSGDHYGVPTETVTGALADGAYATTPPASRLVHALEHGRVAIIYSPDLPEAEQLALKGVFDDDPAGMMLFPNAAQPWAVSVTAWQNYVGCKSYDPLVLDVIRDFRDRYRGNGPEPVSVDIPN